MKIGFIGCGNMGGALVRAAANAEFADSIFIADNFAEKVSALAEECKVNASDVSTISNICDYIYIGVKPQMLDELFSEVTALLRKRSGRFVLVSMCAGISIQKVKNLAGVDCPVIRIMPNMPVSVGKGVVLGASEGTTDSEKETFEKIMSKVGVFDWIEEKYIDAASAVSGCGPAYAYMFIEALADGAVACGLPRDKAQLYAAGMLAGSAEMVLKTGKHPGELKDTVCSPGGTTIAGVKALEDGGFRASAINSVVAAYEKTLSLEK
ncbi:MAG: pyrroline-5-carboxylate reductase [Clostridia bacterium]|nr:pyrroline-5-carboxylate reductase [Clostridia bacterium]